jgi:hypothetical protein
MFWPAIMNLQKQAQTPYDGGLIVCQIGGVNHSDTKITLKGGMINV